MAGSNGAACCLLAAMVFFLPGQGGADETPGDGGAVWSFLAGGGSSRDGWGDTRFAVETVDWIIRRRVQRFGRETDSGKKWTHSFLFEIPCHFVADPDTSVLVGLNFLASWRLEKEQDSWEPYILVGGGPLYANADIPGMGAHINGSYQAGIGLETAGERSRRYYTELRYHHISNAGLDDPNDPINSVKLLMGVSF